MRVDRITSKTTAAEFQLPGAKCFKICVKNVWCLSVVILGLLFVSGIFGQEVYASETKLAYLPSNWQSAWDMPTLSTQLSLRAINLKPEQNEYRIAAQRAPDPSFSAEFVKLTERVATPTPTTPEQKTSDKSYVVYLLVGGLVVLMALFIVVVVKVLKKLKDLSNGR